MSAKTYEKVLSYKVGDATPYGYVHIWSTGSANFAIDNLSIINKDVDAQLMEVEYQSGILEGVEDWEYVPMARKYREDVQKEFDWKMQIVYAIIAGVVIVGGCYGVSKIKKDRKKEGEINE